MLLNTVPSAFVRVEPRHWPPGEWMYYPSRGLDAGAAVHSNAILMNPSLPTRLACYNHPGVLRASFLRVVFLSHIMQAHFQSHVHACGLLSLVCTHTRIHTYIYIYIYTYICIYIYMYIHRHIYAPYLRTSISLFIHIHLHIHIYIYIYVYICMYS